MELIMPELVDITLRNDGLWLTHTRPGSSWVLQALDITHTGTEEKCEKKGVTEKELYRLSENSIPHPFVPLRMKGDE